jgi:hypothetical protein
MSSPPIFPFAIGRCVPLSSPPPQQIPQPLEFIRAILSRTLPINFRKSLPLSYMQQLRQLAYFTPRGLLLRLLATSAASAKLIKEKMDLFWAQNGT